MFITQTNQLSGLKRVERAHVELMAHKETMEYASVIFVGKYEVSDKVPTACTNGVDCMYGRKFIEDMSDSDLRGLIMHENLHKLFQHTFLWKHLYEQNARCANMSCDYVINIIIKDIEAASSGFVTLPKGGLYDEQYRGMDSQEVFNKLLQDSEDEDGNSGDGEDGDEGFDHHDWESGRSDEEIEEIKKDIDQAIRQGQIMAGKLGGKTSRVLEDLLNPKVDWREQLRDFINSLADGKDISTWQRVNRRWLQHDMYMPSTLSESMGRIVIGVDASGSCFDALEPFLSEVQAICMNVQPEMVDLIYWDAEVAAHEVYGRDKQDKLVDSTKPMGGGGTDPTCVSRYLKDNHIKPECVVMLTDGYVFGSWGEWDCPVLWCIVGGNKAQPPVGAAIYVD